MPKELNSSSHELFNNWNSQNIIEGKLAMFMRRLRKSKITCVFDFFLYLLIIGSTILIIYFLWTRVHWLLAVILAFPIYRVIGYPIIFLTAPLYDWLTPENKAWSIYCKALHEGDFHTASTMSEAFERWNEEGDCMDLQECCKRIGDGKSTSLIEDSPEATVEANITETSYKPNVKKMPAKETVVQTGAERADNPQDWWSFEREDDRIEAFLNSREQLLKESLPTMENQSVDDCLRVFLDIRKSQYAEDLQRCKSHEETEVVTGFWRSYFIELCGHELNR